VTSSTGPSLDRVMSMFFAKVCPLRDGRTPVIQEITARVVSAFSCSCLYRIALFLRRTTFRLRAPVSGSDGALDPNLPEPCGRVLRDFPRPLPRLLAIVELSAPKGVPRATTSSHAFTARQIRGIPGFDISKVRSRRTSLPLKEVKVG
jgi:hypothetical protein